jgi:hypothetical protein
MVMTLNRDVFAAASQPRQSFAKKLAMTEIRHASAPG